jgi:hypothetical protein
VVVTYISEEFITAIFRVQDGGYPEDGDDKFL